MAAADNPVVYPSDQHLEAILRAQDINGGIVGFVDINALLTGEK